MAQHVVAKGWKALKIRIRRTFIDPLSGFLYPRGCLGISYDEITLNETSLLPREPTDGMTLVTAYFPFTEDARAVAEDLGPFVANLLNGDDHFAVDSVEVEDFGWAHTWKEFFRPIKIGKSVTVTPSWERGKCSPAETLLVIDPGEAFGTGSHETTTLCIEIIEREFEKQTPERCVDIGCGTGILGILMAKKGAKHVVAIDVDKKAVEISNKNALINDVGSLFWATDLPVGDLGERFDFLTANIIDETLLSMKDTIFSLLGEGGRAVLSGILKENTDWVAEEFHRAGFLRSRTFSLGIWSAILLEKG